MVLNYNYFSRKEALRWFLRKKKEKEKIELVL